MLAGCEQRGNCPQNDLLTTGVRITIANGQSFDNVDPAVKGDIEIAARTAGISEVGVSWTTGGTHGATSRHYPRNNGGVGKAADIYSLDGTVIDGKDAAGKVEAFQSRMDALPRGRENFGPAMIHKNGRPHCTANTGACNELRADHQDHVHHSVN